MPRQICRCMLRMPWKSRSFGSVSALIQSLVLIALAAGLGPALGTVRQVSGQDPPPTGPGRTPPSALPSTAGEAAACGLGRRGGATARSRVPLPLVQEHDQPL